jgi:hypothetical protein
MKHLLLLITVFSSSISLYSQEIQSENDTAIYTVETYSGKTYIGKILSDDGREMLLQTIYKGKIFLKKEDVKLITKGVIQEKEITNNADTSLYFVRTYSGGEYLGKILSDNGKEIQFETEKFAKVFINKASIKDIVKINSYSDIVDGEYVGITKKSLISTRYIISTNAIPIRRGKNYAAVNWFGPEAHFAVTDRLGLGVMTTWIASPIAFNVKYTFKKFSEKETSWNYAFGSIIGTQGYLGIGNNKHALNLGLHWLSLTYGNRNTNITFSSGYSWNDLFDDDYYYKEGEYQSNTTSFVDAREIKVPFAHGPSFGLSGIIKISNETSFIWDNLAFFNSRKVNDITHLPNGNTNVANSTSTSELILIMPGMRFERSHRKSILQFSLILTNKANVAIPNLTWFYKI